MKKNNKQTNKSMCAYLQGKPVAYGHLKDLRARGVDLSQVVMEVPEDDFVVKDDDEEAIESECH